MKHVVRAVDAQVDGLLWWLSWQGDLLVYLYQFGCEVIIREDAFQHLQHPFTISSHPFNLYYRW